MNERLKFALEQRNKYGKFDNFIDESVFFNEWGFGYEWNGKKWIYITHSGKIKIRKNVSIHAGANIVRGTADNDVTEIGEGTKIDFGVHVAHNVKIGKHCLIHAGVVICGSVEIGDHCIIGANAVINRKYKICNNVEILPLSWVCKDINEPGIYGGYPAKKIK